jgi:hypothetical protein
MYTPVNGIASRFNRTAPQYATDKLVADAIFKLALNDKLVDAANQLKKSPIKKANINYVKTELLKKFAFTNNEKLMIANDVLFHAFLSESLKNNGGIPELDIEDIDYHNSQLKQQLTIWNRELIKIYSDLVIHQSGKVIERDEKEQEDKLRKENKLLLAEKDKLMLLNAELTALKADLELKNVTLTSEKSILENDKSKLITEKDKLSLEKKDLERRFGAQDLKLKQLTENLARIVSLINGLDNDDKDGVQKMKKATNILTTKK